METKQAKDSIPKTLRALVVSSMFPFIGDNPHPRIQEAGWICNCWVVGGEMLRSI